MEDEYIYFEFADPFDSKTAFGLKFLNVIFSMFPVTNKNMYRVGKDIQYWRVKLSRDPHRKDDAWEAEIALNEDRTPLFAAPTRENYGMFAEESLHIEVCHQYKATEITKEEFENSWDVYFQTHPSDRAV